jgi:hypothetical protein
VTAVVPVPGVRVHLPRITAFALPPGKESCVETATSVSVVVVSVIGVLPICTSSEKSTAAAIASDKTISSA